MTKFAAESDLGINILKRNGEKEADTLIYTEEYVTIIERLRKL